MIILRPSTYSKLWIFYHDKIICIERWAYGLRYDPSSPLFEKMFILLSSSCSLLNSLMTQESHMCLLKCINKCHLFSRSFFGGTN